MSKYTIYIPRKSFREETGCTTEVCKLNFKMNTQNKFAYDVKKIILETVQQIEASNNPLNCNQKLLNAIAESKVQTIIHSVMGPELPNILLDYLGKPTAFYNVTSWWENYWLNQGDLLALAFSKLIEVKEYPKNIPNLRKPSTNKKHSTHYTPEELNNYGKTDWNSVLNIAELTDTSTEDKYLLPTFFLNTMPEDYTLQKYMGLLHYKKRYSTFEIPKATGTLRKITVPVTKLRRIQNLVKFSYLEPLWESIEKGNYGKCYAYAYRKGISYAKYAEQFVGKKMIYHFDLKDFFSSIRVGHIRNCLRLMCVPEYIRYLIGAIACDTNKRLPQGTTISPILSNIVGHFLIDIPMQNLAKKYGLTYGRYADDLNFGGPKVKDELKFKREIAEILRKNRFRLNTKKTKKYPDNHRQLVLNSVVNQKLSIPKWKQYLYKAILHNCEMHGFIDNYKKFNVRNPALMYHQLFWKIQHYAHTTKNPRMISFFEQLKKIGSHLNDQISTLVYGEEDLKRLYDSTGNLCPPGGTLKIYVDGYSNKKGSGHTLVCPELNLSWKFEHPIKKSNQYAELYGLLEGVKLAVMHSGGAKIPEVMTDSHWLFTKLMQGRATGIYKSKIYYLLSTLYASPNPIIIRHICREENLSDNLKNTEASACDYAN